MNNISKIIEQLIKEHIVSLLIKNGFQRKAKTFYKQNAESISVINIQSDRWNQGLEGKFTINLGTYFPEIEEICESIKFKGLPKEYDCTIRKRIGQTMPGNLDKWWEINSNTNLNTLGSNVAIALNEYGIPWLQSNCIKALIKNELLSQHLYLKAAGLSLLIGNLDEAKEFIQKQLKDKPLAASRTKKWAQRHELI